MNNDNSEKQLHNDYDPANDHYEKDAALALLDRQQKTTKTIRSLLLQLKAPVKM